VYSNELPVVTSESLNAEERETATFHDLWNTSRHIEELKCLKALQYVNRDKVPIYGASPLWTCLQKGKLGRQEQRTFCWPPCCPFSAEHGRSETFASQAQAWNTQLRWGTWSHICSAHWKGMSHSMRFICFHRFSWGARQNLLNSKSCVLARSFELKRTKTLVPFLQSC